MGMGEVEQDIQQALSADTRVLLELLQRSPASQEVLEHCHEHMRAAIELLLPWHAGRDARSAAIVPGLIDFSPTQHDLNALVPHSPVSGRNNPLAPVITFWPDGDKVRGEVVFSANYAGPPDTVHGGVIAGVFDELLSMANIVNQMTGVTGSLTVKYHRPTPINTPVELFAQCVRISGRKVITRGEMRCAGEVTASAQGLFIKLPGQSAGDVNA